MTDAQIFSHSMKNYDLSSSEEPTIFSEIVLWGMCQIIDLVNAIRSIFSATSANP